MLETFNYRIRVTYLRTARIVDSRIVDAIAMSVGRKIVLEQEVANSGFHRLYCFQAIIMPKTTGK